MIEISNQGGRCFLENLDVLINKNGITVSAEVQVTTYIEKGNVVFELSCTDFHYAQIGELNQIEFDGPTYEENKPKHAIFKALGVDLCELVESETKAFLQTNIEKHENSGQHAMYKEILKPYKGDE